jgi:molecular chaperone DnaK
MAKIIGIDLGTTNSAVSVIEGGEPKILENVEGARTTPSVVAKNKAGEIIVGMLAKRQAVTNPENTIVGVKRFIGHDFDEKEVQKNIENVPYTVSKGSKGGVEIELNGEKKRPEEISAMILQKLKADAEAKLGEKVTEAVITVPAYFNDAQRQATKDAGKIAGLDVKRIINEPTAAALAYGFDKKKDQKIVVFDFGGGTFDVSVLEVGDDVVEVKATGGDHSMGGRDIDYAIINYLADEFKKEHAIDLKKDPTALQRLDDEAEKAKLELSTSIETEVNIPFITVTEAGPKNLLIKLTRAKLEELADEYISKAVKITEDVVKDSGFKVSEIDEIIMVGGQTRMPKMVADVEKLFGKAPNQSINPDEVVAMGAALQAGILQGDVKDILLLDVTPLSLGIETMGGVATILIEKNHTIPASKSQVFSTAADNQTSTEIHVVQGERPMSADNKSLGRFILDGIPPAPRGVPQIEVTFDLDANGILNVSAKDKTSGKENSVKIEGSSGLSDEEVEKMKADAAENADADAKKKESVDIKNQAESIAIMAEKAIKNDGDKISEELKKAIEEKIEAVKKANEGDDIEVIKTASDELNTEVQKMMGEMQKKQEEDEKGEAGDKKDDDVKNAEDAEVVEEKEDEKEEETTEETTEEKKEEK